jgi:hypothetical protein
MIESSMLTGAKCADWEDRMRKNHVKIIALAFALQIVLLDAGGQAVAQAGKAAYPAMAPLDQYLISDEKSEIALARSAAPGSISDGAEVMVLGREGYKTAVKGTNGLSLHRGEVVGVEHRSDGVLESEDTCTPLLQRASRDELCAHLSDEDQACAGRKIEA